MLLLYLLTIVLRIPYQLESKLMKCILSVVVLLLSVSAPCKASLPNDAPEDAVRQKVEFVFAGDGKFRRDITPTVIGVFSVINQNWRYAEPNETISTESRFWTTKYIEANAETAAANVAKVVKVPTLVMQCKPEQILEALDDLIDSKAKLECTIATKTSEIFVLRTILGEDLFRTFVVGFHTVTLSQANWSLEGFFNDSGISSSITTSRSSSKRKFSRI